MFNRDSLLHTMSQNQICQTVKTPGLMLYFETKHLLPNLTMNIIRKPYFQAILANPSIQESLSDKSVTFADSINNLKNLRSL